MGRRSVTLAPLAEEGLSRPRLPHHHGPLPGRSKCAAERQARAPCSCFSENKGTEVSGRPAHRLPARSATGWPSFRTPRTPGWPELGGPELGGPPVCNEGSSSGSTGVPRVPVGGRSSAQGQAGEQGSQALPGSRAGGRLKTRWPRFSAELSGSA